MALIQEEMRVIAEQDYFWLCPGGRFFRSFNSGGFGGGASGAFESGNGGVWRVSGSLDGGELLLTFNDSSTARYRLTHRPSFRRSSLIKSS